MTPKVTVVVPTFRRPDGLARALRALARQVDPGQAWDVVVVDNGDGRETAAAFETTVADFPVPASLVSERRAGATYARNAGIAHAAGDIVAFLDDDVVPAPDWLAHLVEPIVAGRADGTGGRVELDPAVDLPSWLGPDWLGYLAAFDRGVDEKDLDPDDYVLTANAAFATERLRAVGGFDEALGPRAGVPMVNDDVDLCRRFRAGGGRIRYVPTAAVVHDVPLDRLTPHYLLRRAYAQGRSDWLLDRARNSERPLGGAQGILIHLGRLLADRAREGLWHGDVAMGAALSVTQVSGFLREAAAGKLQGRRATAP
ncbi:MAG TPA: glycosyltransferase [Acidimicrobiales bacterium]|nr:glycosyltransferase [Acidimicrobiales bacterium]